MSSSASASAYWRVAGMSYLKYSGLCADMVRAALKEPARTKARTREVIFFRRADWKDGQPQKQSKLMCTLMTALFMYHTSRTSFAWSIFVRNLCTHKQLYVCSNHGYNSRRGASEGVTHFKQSGKLFNSYQYNQSLVCLYSTGKMLFGGFRLAFS